MTTWNISDSLTITEPALGTPGSIALTDAAGTNAVTLAANVSTTAYTLTMPTADGAVGNILTTSDASGGTVWSTPSPVFSVWYFKDVKPAGTGGGAFTSGSWITRDLNTTEKAAGVGVEAALSGNNISLSAGVWLLEVKGPAYSCDFNMIRIRNISTATTLVLGTTCRANTGGAGTYSSSSNAQIVYTISSGTELLEIQHRCSTSNGTNGLGRAVNLAASEIYTIVTVTLIG